MQKPSILIVDDQPDNIKILAQILEPSYDLMAATSGEKAIEYVRSTKKPDLILLDVMMPGMDGYEVCRNLKSDR